MKRARGDGQDRPETPFPPAATGRKTVLVADKSAAMRTILQEALAKFGFGVLTTGDAAQLRAFAENRAADILIADESVLDDGHTSLLPLLEKTAPDLPVIVTHAAAPAAPATHYHPRLRARLAKPFDLKGLVALCEETAGVAARPAGEAQAIPLLGKSPATQALRRAVTRLAATDYNVLITGELGTGAELVAEALHEFGKRRAGPFVMIDVDGLSEWRMAAFPDGEAQRTVKMARRGTLYLEEIGDLSLELQARLLRLLKAEAVETPDAPRVVASTCKDLPQLVAQGAFRKDLFYRLNVVPLRLSPLRERLEDLPEIVDAMLQEAVAEGLPVKRVDPCALDCVRQHDWPGNIVELRNFLRRIAVLYSSEAITAEMLRAELAREPAHSPAPEIAAPARNLAGAVEDYIGDMLRDGVKPPSDLYDRLMHEIEAPLIRRVLHATGGNKLKAAEILGLNRNTLRKKVEKLGI